MRRLLLFLLAVVLSAPVHAQLVRPGEWIVRRADDGMIQEKDLTLIPTKVFDSEGQHDFAVFARYDRVMGVKTDERGAELLRKQGFSVEPNREFKLLGSFSPVTKVEGDGVPWELRRIGQRGALSTTSGSGILLPTSHTGAIYIFDTYAYDGRNGEVFGDRLVRGPDFVGTFDDPNNLDCRVHGTAMAYAVHAVNPSALLVSIRVGGCNNAVSWLASQAAGDWLVDHGATLYGPGPVNLSFGASGFTENPLARQFSRMKQSGFTTIAAAANEGRDAATVAPCRYSDLCVGATDETDKRASFSNFGSNVDLFAPGKNIDFVGPDGNEWTGSGTSASCPLTGGVWTLLHGTFPALPPSRITALLVANATRSALTDIGAGSPNLLLYGGAVTETLGQNFFRYFRGQKRFTASVTLSLNGGKTQSAWVDFYRGGKGANGACQGKPYARALVSTTGTATTSVSGWSAPPAKGCFRTELGGSFERQVVSLP